MINMFLTSNKSIIINNQLITNLKNVNNKGLEKHCIILEICTKYIL